MIIVIEGGDQAGKLTQSVLLQKFLRKQKIKTKLFHFPDYETPIGKEIRKYLDGKRKFPPQVIHCLLAANRWEKFDEIIKSKEKNSVSKESLAYVNRLSDLCFVAARYANQTERGGQGDVLWRPGKTKVE